jgi:hypothetical protein
VRVVLGAVRSARADVDGAEGRTMNGQVLQFRRKPAARLQRGFVINIDPVLAPALAEQWGIQQREKWRISPDRDGTVVLEFAVEGGVVRMDLAVEDAELLRSDLSHACVGAERQRVRLRGVARWRAEPIEGRDAFSVRWNDHVATFVGVTLRRGRVCGRCNGSFPPGTRMYRQEGRSAWRWRGGPRTTSAGSILGDMDRRVCRACMSPAVEGVDAPGRP